MKRLARFGFALFKFLFYFCLNCLKCLTRSGDARGRLEQCARGFFKFLFYFLFLFILKSLTLFGDARGRLEQCARGFFKHAEAEKGQWQALARSLARALVILTLIYAIVLIMSLY